MDRWHTPERIILSCLERCIPGACGDIRYYVVSTGETGIFERHNEPQRLKAFRPHGIDIRKAETGDILLYVILHDPYDHNERSENAVGIYKVENNSLVFMDLLEDKVCLWSPNDLSVLDNGEIYLTNDFKSNWDLYLKRSRSQVSRYDPLKKTWTFVAQGLCFANGILARPDRVYVAETLGNRILEFPRNNDGSLGEPKEIARIKGVDNIMPYADGFFVAAHFDDLAFMRHAKDPAEQSPSVVFFIRPEYYDKTPVFADPGKFFSAASTAVGVGRILVVGQVFDGYLLVCTIPPGIGW